MVDVVKRMFEFVKNFKNVLQNDVNECIHQSAEKNHWKNSSEQLMNRICELKASKTQLLAERKYLPTIFPLIHNYNRLSVHFRYFVVDELKNHNDERSTEDLDKRVLLLQEMRDGRKSIVNYLTEVKTQKKALIEWKQQIISESENLKNSSLANFENCDKMNNLRADEIDSLRAEIIDTDKNHRVMMQELENLVDQVENE